MFCSKFSDSFSSEQEVWIIWKKQQYVCVKKYQIIPWHWQTDNWKHVMDSEKWSWIPGYSSEMLESLLCEISDEWLRLNKRSSIWSRDRPMYCFNRYKQICFFFLLCFSDELKKQLEMRRRQRAVYGELKLTVGVPTSRKKPPLPHISS